jgi:hypothetical protein
MPNPDNQLPIQPVERPILCDPYEEPAAHWEYDSGTDKALKISGRRPASYWFKTERAFKRQLALYTEETREAITLVNNLINFIRYWHKSDYEQFSAFSGTQSLPFSVGKNKKVALKVFEPRGNEAIRVLNV